MSDERNDLEDGTAADTDVDRWIADVPALLMRLETWHTPEGFATDRTPESLRLLEEALVLGYEPEGTDESRDFLQGAMACLGETLMQIGGGRWGWSDGGHPLVLPDAELGLEPLDPLKLVIEAQERADFKVFTGTARALSAAVEARRSSAPGWKPVKQRTPGLDPWARNDPHPWLAGWLADRREAFAAWAADTGADPRTWDFSPTSLDTLGDLVIARYASEDAYRADEYGPFVQGAVWYVGEVAVHHKAGAWAYHEAEPRIPREEVERNIFLERPFVNQPTVRDGIGDVPFHVLAIAVDDRDPSALREHLDWYRDPDPEGGPVSYRGTP